MSLREALEANDELFIRQRKEWTEILIDFETRMGIPGARIRGELSLVAVRRDSCLALLGAQPHQRLVGDDAVDPGRDLCLAPEAGAVANDLLEAALHDGSRRLRIPGETEGHRREPRLEAREQGAQPLAVGVGENVLRLAAAGPTRTALEAKVDPAPGGGPER